VVNSLEVPPNTENGASAIDLLHFKATSLRYWMKALRAAR
jgi:hypothetical protein